MMSWPSTGGWSSLRPARTIAKDNRGRMSGRAAVAHDPQGRGLGDPWSFRVATAAYMTLTGPTSRRNCGSVPQYASELATIERLGEAVDDDVDLRMVLADAIRIHLVRLNTPRPYGRRRFDAFYHVDTCSLCARGGALRQFMWPMQGRGAIGVTLK